jgi:hypothetical protein
MRKKYRDKISLMKMDIEDTDAEMEFMKKQIKELQERKLYARIHEPLEDDALLLEICKRVKAIAEYLKIEFHNQWEIDPTYLNPEPRMRPILTAKKKK